MLKTVGGVGGRMFLAEVLQIYVLQRQVNKSTRAGVVSHRINSD